MLRRAVPLLMLMLIVVPLLTMSPQSGCCAEQQYAECDDIVASSVLGLTADDPVRDRIIAGIAVIVLVGSIFAAIYYIARKEGL